MLAVVTAGTARCIFLSVSFQSIPTFQHHHHAVLAQYTYVRVCLPPSTLPPSPHSVHPTCVNEHRIGVVVALRVPVPTKTSAFALRRRVSMSTCARARVHVQMCAHSNYTTTTATRTDYMPVRARAPQTPSRALRVLLLLL